jgi:hypothetical protein
MSPLPTVEGSAPGGPETAALPESPTRKTRFVRIRRDGNGVETSRTYTDVTAEESERTPLSPLKIVKGRSGGSEPSKTLDDSTPDYGYNDQNNQPASPIKKTLVRVRRNSNGVELSRTTVDVTDEPNETSMAKDVMVSPTKTRLVRVRRNSLGMETSRTYVDSDGNSSQGSVGEDGTTQRQLRRSSMGVEGSSNHSREDNATAPYLSMNPEVTTISPTKTRLVRVRRNSLGMETSRVYVDAIGLPDGATSSHHNDEQDLPNPMFRP